AEDSRWGSWSTRRWRETTFGVAEVVVAAGGVLVERGGRRPRKPVAGELPSFCEATPQAAVALMV
ncbi:hypothetical protein Dimus_037097, partial [Dionaea muscipula]